MSASEFAFLALGLILGVAAGAAIIFVLRSRPPSPREVRLTVTPDSIPRRATTLNSTDLSAPLREPARGGPGANGDPLEARHQGGDANETVAEMAGNRTSVHDAARMRAEQGGEGAGSGAPDAGSRASARTATAGRPEPIVLGPPLSVGRRDAAVPGVPALVGASVRHERNGGGSRFGADEPLVLGGGTARGLVGIEVGGDAGPRAVPRGAPSSLPVAAARPSPANGGGARGAFADSGSLVRSESASGSAEPQRNGDASAAPSATRGATTAMDVCAAERRIAEERCGNADRLAGLAGNAQSVLREAQLTADKHQTRATEAATRADPRGIRAAKEAAQQAFRTARAAATTRDGVESAARAWLAEINRINREAREATLAHRREQDAANALLSTIERLSVEADAARITAEAAQEVCVAAREALAECEEAAARAAREGARMADAVADAPATPAETAAGEPERTPVLAEIGAGVRAGPMPDDAGSPALVAEEGTPALFRLLRGDRDVMRHVVDELSGGDPAERRRWQLQLSDLVDALLARAIEASTLGFPERHPFWAMFSQGESRDIAAALSSLGYRFDGLGGFVDGRIPSQRDLSLAVGYAGLDPMRIRRWPNEAEMPALFAEVTVAADEYVAGAAGNFTLGDLITVLGRRADGLADLWNAWGRVRPLLVSTSVPV